MKRSLATTLVLMLLTSGAAARMPEWAVAQLLDRKIPEVNFNEVALEDALQFIQDVSGLNVVPYWNEIEQAGIKRTAPINAKDQQIPTRDLLNKVLAAVNTEKTKLTFVVDGDIVVIAPADDPKNPRPRTSIVNFPPNQDRVLREIKFSGTKLADVLDYYREISGMGMTVDYKALESAGITKDTVCTLHAREINCSQFLKHLFNTIGNGKAQVVITAGDKLNISAQPATKPSASTPKN